MGVGGEDGLGGNELEDVFIDGPDHVTFVTGGIQPAYSAQLPGVLTSQGHIGDCTSTFVI